MGDHEGVPNVMAGALVTVGVVGVKDGDSVGAHEGDSVGDAENGAVLGVILDMTFVGISPARIIKSNTRL